MEDIMIKCPICGREHLPAEIFFPDDLICSISCLLQIEWKSKALAFLNTHV